MYEAVELDPIPVKRLDDMFTADQRIRLLKVDVEGHEHDVIMSARNLLFARAVDVIVLENNGGDGLTRMVEFLLHEVKYHVGGVSWSPAHEPFHFTYSSAATYQADMAWLNGANRPHELLITSEPFGDKYVPSKYRHMFEF